MQPRLGVTQLRELTEMADALDGFRIPTTVQEMRPVASLAPTRSRGPLHNPGTEEEVSGCGGSILS